MTLIAELRGEVLEKSCRALAGIGGISIFTDAGLTIIRIILTGRTVEVAENALI